MLVWPLPRNLLTLFLLLLFCPSLPPSGLKFSTTITKFGVAVDKTEEMIGSFACGEKLIKYRMPEESAPSGMMMRTSFSAQGKLQDDDDKVHAQWNYAFEIKKNWP